MSTMQGVRFISLNVTGEKEISFNIKYVGGGSTPPVLIVATAITNGTGLVRPQQWEEARYWTQAGVPQKALSGTTSKYPSTLGK